MPAAATRGQLNLLPRTACESNVFSTFFYGHILWKICKKAINKYTTILKRVAIVTQKQERGNTDKKPRKLHLSNEDGTAVVSCDNG